MKFIKPLLILICILPFIAACSSEKRQSELLEKKLKKRVAAASAMLEKIGKEMNGQIINLSIASPINVSLNLKEKTAITTTDIKITMQSARSSESEIIPARIAWRLYEDGDWQIEYVIPLQLMEMLQIDQMVERLKKMKR